MFLERLKENNSKLVEFAFDAHNKGTILPDTYILDYDTIMANGKIMLDEAKEHNVRLFFMLKQIGRNPEIAKGLMDLGFAGCVAVDYKEALLMIDNFIPLGNVGHLVQVPKKAMRKILSSKPEVVTVYSKETIKEINDVCADLHLSQPLLLRVMDENSKLYSGQVGGFKISELDDALGYIKTLEHVTLGGFTVFPALLYDEASNEIKETANMQAMYKAKEIAEKYEYKDLLINLPSATCYASIPLIEQLGGNNGEPGHGLSGTTPLHKYTRQPENVGYVYVSEVSHNFEDKAYCYGGGHYRRGHMENVLVGTSPADATMAKISAPDDDSIDYYFEIDRNEHVGDACIMCFRTQMFTTRSTIAVVRGLHADHGVISGYYDGLGNKMEMNW